MPDPVPGQVLLPATLPHTASTAGLLRHWMWPASLACFPQAWGRKGLQGKMQSPLALFSVGKRALPGEQDTLPSCSTQRPWRTW